MNKILLVFIMLGCIALLVFSLQIQASEYNTAEPAKAEKVSAVYSADDFNQDSNAESAQSSNPTEAIHNHKSKTSNAAKTESAQTAAANSQADIIPVPGIIERIKK